jgi:polysaccharide export outer membrane protein
MYNPHQTPAYLSHKLIQLLAILLLATYALVVPGCSSAPKVEDQTIEDALVNYREQKKILEKSDVVSPGFRLSINHSADREISGEYKVDYKGELSLPLRVKVKAGGLRVAELEQLLEKAYEKFYKVKNTVNVQIVSREYLIEVRGLVQKPGIYTVKLDTSIEEVMALAGGLAAPAGSANGSDSKSASLKPEFVRIVTADFMQNAGKENKGESVRWIRLTDYFLRYDPRNEVLWRGGEQLFFQMSADASAMAAGSQTIQVLGEVHRPGEYPLQQGLDLHWYVGQAGGPTSTADLNAIVLIRKSKESTESINFSSANRPLNLMAGDVILVPSTQFKPSMLERFGPFFVSLGSLFISVLVAFLVL